MLSIYSLIIIVIFSAFFSVITKFAFNMILQIIKVILIIFNILIIMKLRNLSRIIIRTLYIRFLYYIEIVRASRLFRTKLIKELRISEIIFRIAGVIILIKIIIIINVVVISFNIIFLKKLKKQLILLLTSAQQIKLFFKIIFNTISSIYLQVII